MKIVMNKWFELPWVGKETYADLMKAKVKQDKKFGFKITSETNMSRALSILSAALDEPVEVARSCFLCDGPIEEEAEVGVSESSLCGNCVRNEDAYDLYVMKFAKLMETA
jgi:hypothetical protein